MKKICLLLLVSVLFSCQKSVKKESFPKLNGYWEIQQVQFENGEEKDYKVNETVDYFELRQDQANKKWIGFRQKVMPQFNGRFITNGIKEYIVLTEDKGLFYINYKTDLAKWKEQIIELGDSTLALKSEDNLTYLYKRFVPFSLK